MRTTDVASRTKYVLDANVLMEAKRRYYRFGICPGFWECLSWHYKQGRVRSIDRVRKELDIGKDELTRWAKKGAPAGFFAATTDNATADLYGEMVAWTHEQPHYLPPALTEFATDADGWLVAYAKTNGLVVVTHEVFSDARNEVKIPNVCKAFDVAHVDTFDMLEDLKAVFAWKGKT